MRLAFTDSGNDPTNLTTRQAYDLLSDGFGPGFNGPLVLAAELPGGARTAPWSPPFEHRLARPSRGSSGAARRPSTRPATPR